MRRFRRAVVLLCIVVLTSAWRSVRGEERGYEPETAYEAYFRDRYGTDDEPLDPEVVEQRCRGDIIQHLTLLHTEAVFLDYYSRVVRLWREHASADSLPALERLIEVCWFIDSEQIGEVNPDAKAHHWNIWLELSETWLNIRLRTAGKAERAGILLGALTPTGKHHPNIQTLPDRIRKLEASTRDRFFKIILEEDLREDVIFALNGVVGSEPFKPTEQELDAMLNHSNKNVRYAAKCYLLDYRYDDPRGHALALADLGSDDGIGRGITTITDYLRRPIDTKTRKKLLAAVHDRLREAEAAIDAGRGALGRTGAGAFNQMASAVGMLLSGTALKGDHVGDSELEVLENHVAWLERTAERLKGLDIVDEWPSRFRRQLEALKRLKKSG